MLWPAHASAAGRREREADRVETESRSRGGVGSASASIASTKSALRPRERGAQTVSPKATVLIVDDEADVLEVLE